MAKFTRQIQFEILEQYRARNNFINYTRKCANQKFQITAPTSKGRDFSFSGITGPSGKTIPFNFTLETDEVASVTIEVYENDLKAFSKPVLKSGKNPTILDVNSPKTQLSKIVKYERNFACFRLSYSYIDLDGNRKQVNYAGMKYRVVDETGLEHDKGQTDVNGYTAELYPRTNATFKLEIYDEQDKVYRTPRVVGDAAEIDVTKAQRDTTKEIRLSTYLMFKVTRGGKPIPQTKVTTTKTGSDIGRGYITKLTNAKGLTSPEWTAYATRMEYQLPKTSKTLKDTVECIPVPDGTYKKYIYDLPVVKKNTAPKQGHKATLGAKTNTPVIVDLQNERIILVQPEHFEEAKKVSSLIEQKLSNVHDVRQKMVDQLSTRNLTSEQVAKLEKELGTAVSDAESTLKGHFKQKADLREIFVLENVQTGKNKKTDEKEYGFRRRYVSKEVYAKLYKKRLNKTKDKIKLHFKDPSKVKTLSKKKLKDSVEDISTSLKADLGKTGGSIDITLLDNLLNIMSHELSESIQKSENLQVDTNAQWLRMVGGAGASRSANWKPLKGKVDVGIKGHAQGKLVLAEGSYKRTYAWPSLNGWMLELAGEDLGMIRFIAGFELYGFVGAKIALNGKCEIKYDKNDENRQKVVSTVDDNLEDKKNDKSTQSKNSKMDQPTSKLWDNRSKMPKFQLASAHETPKNRSGSGLDVGANVSGDAFAGAEASVTPAGALEWKNPTKKDFVELASMSATLGVSAGIGGEFDFYIFYDSGKFKVKAKAAACYGFGAKGAVEFVVGSNNLAEFAYWVFTQLLHAGFKLLVFIQAEAFELLTKLSVLIVGKDHSITKSLKWITDDLRDFQNELEKADNRLKLARRINKAQLQAANKSATYQKGSELNWLMFATPEAKGILVYELTRFSGASHLSDTPSIDFEWKFWESEAHTLPERKKALLKVFSTITTKAEWENVIQHRTFDGRHIDKVTSSQLTKGRVEGDIMRFLNKGANLADELETDIFDAINRGDYDKGGATGKGKDKTIDTHNSMLDKYLKMRRNLLIKWPKGQEVVMQTDPRFDMIRNLYDGKVLPEFYSSPETMLAGNFETLTLDPETGELTETQVHKA